MAKAIIHVNRSLIAKNAKDGGNRPVFTIKRSGKTTYCRDFVAHGPLRGVGTKGQLGCGARAWLETEGEIEMIDPMTWREVKALG